MTESIERIYAKALIELADETDHFDTISAQVTQLGEIVENNPDLRKLLESKILSTEDRAECLKNIFEGKIDDLLYRFLLVVNAKNRLALLPGFVHAFAELEHDRSNVAVVDIWTANDLSHDEFNNIAARLGESLKKTIKLNQHTDPSLIAGVKIQIGDKQIDACVAKQLHILRHQCITTGREHTRTNHGSLITE